MSSNGEDLTARITKMITDATQQEWDALTDSAWADYCEWLSEQRSAAGDSLTTQLAKLMFEDHAGLGWGGVSESVREIYARAADTVITHLTAAGCLIPAGGMALTAEQVEDVRTMLWSPGVTALAAFRRLRALFPATEPTEERCRKWTVRVAGGIETGIQCVLPAGHECFHDYVPPIHNYVHPTPAEPAEEETKAEAFEAALDAGMDEMRWEIDEKGGEVFESAKKAIGAALFKFSLLTSSPVVPAPTETGPWPSIEKVPTGLAVIGTNGERFIGCPCESETHGYTNQFAPFVAAEEGK